MIKLIKTLGLALVYLPILSLIILVFFTVAGATDDLISKIQTTGNYWGLLLTFYLFSLIYSIFEPIIRKNIERKKIVEALLIYFQDRYEIENKKQPSKKDLELIQNMLLQRFKIWAWLSPKLWNEHFPDEKYSKSLFGMVDNFIQYSKNIIAKMRDK